MGGRGASSKKSGGDNLSYSQINAQVIGRQDLEIAINKEIGNGSMLKGVDNDDGVKTSIRKAPSLGEVFIDVSYKVDGVQNIDTYRLGVTKNNDNYKYTFAFQR